MQPTDRVTQVMRNPALHALICFTLAFVFSLVGYGIMQLDFVPKSDRLPWLFAGSFLLFYAVLNSISYLAAENKVRYFNLSMASFLGLGIALILMAWGLSGLPINRAGTYQWIFTVVAIGYMLFISLMRTMRKIMELAQNEDDKIQEMMNETRKKSE